MTRKSRFRASGKNDIWFACICLAALIAWGLFGHAPQTQTADPEQIVAEREQ